MMKEKQKQILFLFVSTLWQNKSMKLRSESLSYLQVRNRGRVKATSEDGDFFFSRFTFFIELYLVHSMLRDFKNYSMA